MPGIKFFLSATTSEFGEDREYIRSTLTGPEVEAKIQDDFNNLGVPTLQMLDEYIAACDCVVHIVGNRPGFAPPVTSIVELLRKYPSLLNYAPGLDPVSELGEPSYTHWEAYLALLHGKRLMVFRPSPDFQREIDAASGLPSGDDRLRQAKHVERLRKQDYHPTLIANRDRLLTAIALQALDLYRHANIAPPVTGEPSMSLSSIAPPSVTQFTERRIVEHDVLSLLKRSAEVGAGLVSLEGIGGSGKTSLAARIVSSDEAKLAFPGGRIWLTVGRERTDERLSSYLCDVVQALTGTHFAAEDLGLSSVALIDVLAARGSPTLLVLDDVWTDDQVRHLLRGGASVTRLVVSRNKLGAVDRAWAFEMPMMSQDEALHALHQDLPEEVRSALLGKHTDALLRFSHRWPLLLGLMNAALKENIASGADPANAAKWLVDLVERSGPAVVDGLVSVSREKSIEMTLNATLDLVEKDTRALFASLCIFAEDRPIPDYVISGYWDVRHGVSRSECSRVLSKLTHLRLLNLHWVNGERGFLLHDVFRDLLIHQTDRDQRRVMSRDLVESWRSLLPSDARGDWWQLSHASTFVFENLITQLSQGRLFVERDALQQDLRWYMAQIMSLGSATVAIADLESRTEQALVSLRSYFSEIVTLLRREATRGGLASTLLSYVATTRDKDVLIPLVQEFAQELDCSVLRSAWPLSYLPPQKIKGHFGPIGDIAVSPDGRSIATASDDGIALIFDAVDCNVRCRLRGHSERVRSCAFSPSGSELLTSGMDGTARIWNAVTGERTAVLGNEQSSLLGSCWSPSGRLVAGAFMDGTTRIWNVSGAELVCELQTERSGGTWDCKFLSEDELVTVGDDGCVRCWRWSEHRCLADIKAHTQKIRRCDVSRDGTRAVTASSDGTSAVIDLRTQLVSGYLRGHSARVRSAVFSKDATRIVTASEDRTARVWDVVGLSRVAEIVAHGDWVGKAIFDDTGTLIYTCGGDASVVRWRATGTPVTSYEPSVLLERDGNDTSSCCFTRDGSSVLYGKVDAVKALTLDGHSSRDFGGHSGRVLAVTADDQLLFSSGSDGRLVARRLSDGHVTAEHIVGSRVWSIAAADRAGIVVSAAEDGLLRMHARGDLSVLGTVVSRDGHLMACAINAQETEVCFVGDGAALRTTRLEPPYYESVHLLSGFRSIWSCAYSGDGSRIAVAGEPGGQTLLIHSDGTPPSVLLTSAGRITSIAFSCDDRFIATCGDDGYIAIWDAESGRPVTGLRTQFPLRRCAWSRRDPNVLAAAGIGGELLLELRQGGQND